MDTFSFTARWLLSSPLTRWRWSVVLSEVVGLCYGGVTWRCCDAWGTSLWAWAGSPGAEGPPESCASWSARACRSGRRLAWTTETSALLGPVCGLCRPNRSTKRIRERFESHTHTQWISFPFLPVHCLLLIDLYVHTLLSICDFLTVNGELCVDVSNVGHIWMIQHAFICIPCLQLSDVFHSHIYGPFHCTDAFIQSALINLTMELYPAITSSWLTLPQSLSTCCVLQEKEKIESFFVFCNKGVW